MKLDASQLRYMDEEAWRVLIAVEMGALLPNSMSYAICFPPLHSALSPLPAPASACHTCSHVWFQE
jgi:hypothetical protein